MAMVSSVTPWFSRRFRLSFIILDADRHLYRNWIVLKMMTKADRLKTIRFHLSCKRRTLETVSIGKQVRVNASQIILFEHEK